MFGWYKQGTRSSNVPVKVKPGGRLPYTAGKPTKTPQPRAATKTKSTQQSKPLTASRKVESNQKTIILYKKFLVLHEKALKKAQDIELFRGHLKNQLNDVNIALNQRMDKAQKREMDQLIDSLCNAQRDLRSSLVNNLRAGYKAISMIDTLSQTVTPEQQKVLALVKLAFNDVHDTVDNMLSTQINNFGIHDLNYLSSIIKNLEAQINLPEFKQLSSSILTDPQAHSAFTKQIASCSEMIKVFNEASEVLTKTEIKKDTPLEVTKSAENETIIDVFKQGFDEYIQEAIHTLKTENIKSAKFWGTISALVAIAGLAILVTTIVLALTIYTGGTLGVVLIILGSVLGGGSIIGGTAGGLVSFTMATESDAPMEPVLKLKQSLSVLQKLSHPKAD